ncbi:hypothetical protein BRADI_1g69970v3 [Brachypodium distachyon]|uniref:Ninja-family protein n=2 Tax=Brachypodium distachyon TaxID=15368 RepID=I1H839_BRADI|nr:hypothetical protein BRADI_1g69970v3 [Brachypodium distachyon]
MRQRLREIKKKNSSSVSKGAAGEIPGSSKSMETMLTEDEMPGVSTTGLPWNVEGFLYNYMTGPVVIVCVCHGSFMSPEEFMKHAGAVNVQNPTQHIVMKNIV